MRRTTALVAEIALALAAAALLVALAVPWPPVPDPDVVPVAPRAEATSPPSPEPRAEIAPGDIEALFVGRLPVAARAAATREAVSADPVAADWLRYLGRSRAPDGTTQVFVKDTRSGAVITAARGRVVDGWTLVEEDGVSVTLGRGDERYSVPRR
jgi:hypothetical protein